MIQKPTRLPSARQTQIHLQGLLRPSYSSTSPVDLAACLSPANDMSRAFAINSDAILAFIQEEGCPCDCGELEGFAGGGGGGLSIERFTAAMAAVAPQLTEEQIAFGWERFLYHYNN